VLTPFYPQLLVVSTVGDFEQVLSFGIGLVAQASYHSYALTGPYRVVLDVSHVALGKFPGIWDITSWQQYWQSQYAWINGHQPWLANPAMVVQAWARGRWQGAHGPGIGSPAAESGAGSLMPRPGRALEEETLDAVEAAAHGSRPVTGTARDIRDAMNAVPAGPSALAGSRQT
jgi:hypothetical protein